MQSDRVRSFSKEGPPAHGGRGSSAGLSWAGASMRLGRDYERVCGWTRPVRGLPLASSFAVSACSSFLASGGGRELAWFNQLLAGFVTVRSESNAPRPTGRLTLLLSCSISRWCSISLRSSTSHIHYTHSTQHSFYPPTLPHFQPPIYATAATAVNLLSARQPTQPQPHSRLESHSTDSTPTQTEKTSPFFLQL